MQNEGRKDLDKPERIPWQSLYLSAFLRPLKQHRQTKQSENLTSSIPGTVRGDRREAEQGRATL